MNFGFTLGIMVPKFFEIVIDSIVCSISFFGNRKKHLGVPNRCINFSIRENFNKENAEIR